MGWQVIYNTATGEMVTEATTAAEVPTPLRSGLSVKDVGAQPNWATQQWNAATKTIQARPAPTADPVVTAGMTALGKASATATLADVMDAQKVIARRLGIF